jgi:hypothetical protein
VAHDDEGTAEGLDNSNHDAAEGVDASAEADIDSGSDLTDLSLPVTRQSNRRLDQV